MRKIVWHNPPFCKSVKTNLGKEFFKILRNCFPPENPLSKIFNNNTVKLSYSCMPSIGKTISGHNQKILNPPQVVPPCRCTVYDCEVEGNCEQRGIIYQCKVTEKEGGTSSTYVGLSENSFKDRLTKHRKSFNTQGYHKNTLSTHIWDLKRRHIDFELSWKILAKGKPYSPSSKICELCIKEINYIMFEKNMASLNSRNEFFGFCLHKAKYQLQNQ